MLKYENQADHNDGPSRLLPRIVVTGVGICSAIGNNTDDVIHHLVNGKSTARGITRFRVDPFQTRVAAEVKLDRNSLPSEQEREGWDRGTLMAMVAVRQAVCQAAITLTERDPLQVGVVTGVSGSGQFQTARAGMDRQLVLNRRTAEVILEKNVPNFQAEQIARHFDFDGPQTTVSSASAGSGIAVAIAMRWLQACRCDAVVVGGSECLSVLNIIGFDVLGITAPKHCRPFSNSNGMMMGEGAGYLVLEREETASQRGAQIVGFVDGAAVSADAFDPVLFDPTGNGQQRAMQGALLDGNTTTDQVGWLRASGSGGQDQDSAELMAIQQLFGENAPPITSLEPFFGHCNGAGPAIGMIAALSSMNTHILPPTLNFSSDHESPTRLDFVPNEARLATVDTTLCNSAAFGGTNVAILCSKWGGASRSQREDDILITGIGSVSAVGVGGREIFQQYLEPTSGIERHDRFDWPAEFADVSGLIRGVKIKKRLPQLSLRGVDLLAQYAALASHHALHDGKLAPGQFAPERVGVVSGISHASGATLERLMREIYQDFRRPTVGKVMLRNGRFLVTSQLAHWFSMKGYNSTLASGELSGLHALATAADQLRLDPTLDALLVVAADEVSSLFTQLYAQRGDLVQSPGLMNPYSADSTGRILGEGAVAMVIERAETARRRGAPTLGRISGHAMQFAAENESEKLDHTINLALADAACDPTEIGSLSGLGTGNWERDRIELESVRRVFGTDRSLNSLSGHTGFMDSASGLWAVMSGLIALNTARNPSTLGIELRPGSRSPTQAKHALPATGEALTLGAGRLGHQMALILTSC